MVWCLWRQRDRIIRLRHFNHQTECSLYRDRQGEHTVTVRDYAEELNENYGCSFDLEHIAAVEAREDEAFERDKA